MMFFGIIFHISQHANFVLGTRKGCPYDYVRVLGTREGCPYGYYMVSASFSNLFMHCMWALTEW